MNRCHCGCGAAVRNLYLPGHDAKHISYLLSINASMEMAGRELPTRPLRESYQKLHENRVAKRMSR